MERVRDGGDIMTGTNQKQDDVMGQSRLYAVRFGGGPSG